MNSLMTCSGWEVLLQRKEKEKECVVEDIGYNPHKHRRVLRKVFPFPLKNFALGLEIHNNSKTIVVSTTRMLCSLMSNNW